MPPAPPPIKETLIGFFSIQGRTQGPADCIQVVMSNKILSSQLRNLYMGDDGVHL